MSAEESNIDRPTRGGYRESDRPDCGVTSWGGDPCKNPAIPTIGVCHKHLDHALDDDDDDDDDRPVWESGGANV